jgi:beta-glucanase (GH16 family)
MQRIVKATIGGVTKVIDLLNRGGMADANLLWSDEFTGTSLSLATDSGGGTWRTKGYEAGGSLSTGYTDFAGSSWNVSPGQHPTAFPVTVSGSVLTVTAKRNPGLSGVTNDWIGAYLVTNHLTGLHWRYGYFEWRARFPVAARGMFPALWLFNNISGRSDGKEGAELDMLEIFGAPSGLPWSSGWHNNPTPGTSGNAGNFSTDTAGWHRYGIEWTATAVRWYKDGAQVAELTGTNATWFATADLGIRINYAMDPNWLSSGDPNKSTSTDPASGVEPRLEVDYVRVFDHKPGSLPTGSADPLLG